MALAIAPLRSVEGLSVMSWNSQEFSVNSHRVCQIFCVTDLSGRDSAFEKAGELIEGFLPVFDGFSPFLAIFYRVK